MAKDRSAISKSMSKKKNRVSGTHVSGLASSKASKRKEAPIKYGQLSRRQKQDLEDYGELVPKDFEDDEEEGTKRRRIVSETDLDRELEEERRRAEGEFSDSQEEMDEESEEDEEGEDWKKPSPYSLLMNSLKKSSKQKEFYKKIQLEQEGIDEPIINEVEENNTNIEEENINENEEGTEDLVDDEETNLDDEEEEEESADKDEADPFEENDEDEEIVYVGSDAEEDEGEQSYDDLFDIRFADQQPTSFDEKISIVEQKKWTSQIIHDETLLDLNVLTTEPDDTIKEMPTIKKLTDMKVSERVSECWIKANKKVVKKALFTPLQNNLFTQMNNYRDVLFCNRTMDNAKEIRNTYALHAINHITKARKRVLRNNNRLAKAQKEEKDIGELRDQGFTRPKVLILLPFRNTVIDVVDTLIKLSGVEKHDNKNRFYEQFNLHEEEAIDTTKPLDYLQNFQGNIDDHFRLGIKFSKKSLKLYANFYNADIIIASPLGLRTLIGAEGDKKRDFDYLSSIEMVILDQTNHFLMQNWEHIEHIFEHMNLIPKDTHGCDISRIRNWYLDGKAKYLRQTLIFADFLTPEFNALFNKHMKNVSGKLKIKRTYEEGSIIDVIPQVQQTFTRIDAPSLKAMNDTRYKYFIEKTLPALRKSAIMQSHTLIFIPSYFDFVRIRNYFEDNRYSYEPCSEYSSGSQITRARSQFFHGRTNFLLYTERLHFFRRFVYIGFVLFIYLLIFINHLS
ncbi:uncharacterized protein BX663DRAFT_503540 [Cokeromyces recurvatus]|uniref:uncharacterized protein n=1 Tax=Cokeromyces recurvatus TaxID=90255 RepID=UPI0022209718|nr:uncharacterized protein BX663DRAFT_503540 [Cokeromyces recurvatus]KAI7904789.1 hypothetical protein BX663DRAFT_503540 [Cokeromyces recurvatus]